MTKKKPKTAETPNEGGSYVRNPKTGKPELAKSPSKRRTRKPPVKPPVKSAKKGAEK